MPARKTRPKQPAKQPAKKRIVLIDDHALMRRGLKTLIESEPDLLVCAEAATRTAGFDAVLSSKPDLVIADLSLGNGDGMELIKDIHGRLPRLPVLVLSMHDEEVYAERVLRAGARGYLAKKEMDDTVLIAIRRVLAGEIHTSDAIARKFTGKFADGGAVGKAAGVDGLSDRELEVFTLIGRGIATGEIARSLRLSVNTIDSYRAQLKVKLNLSSGAELGRLAHLWVETGRLD